MGIGHLLFPQAWSHHVGWVDSEITTPYQSLPGRVGSEASSSCSPQWPLPTALSCSFYPAGLLSSCHGHLTSDAFVLSQVAKLMLHTHLWRHSLILELGTQAYYLDISQKCYVVGCVYIHENANRTHLIDPSSVATNDCNSSCVVLRTYAQAQLCFVHTYIHVHAQPPAEEVA